MRLQMFACCAVVALVLSLQLGQAFADNPAPTSASHAPLPVVSVVEAGKRDVIQTIVVNGTLTPRDEILVTPEIEGYRVTEVLFEEGDRVAKGQVLIRLSRDLITQQIAQQNAVVDRAKAAISQAQTNILQAEAAEVEARQAFERARLLMQGGNTTAVIMEGRTAALRQAEGRLAIARHGLAIAIADRAQARAVEAELALRLARTEIRAPEAGVVSRRAARVGMTATASSEPLARIIARGEIELEGEVLDASLPLFREGALALIDLGHGGRAQGRVRVVYPEVDRTTRLGKVRISLSPDPRLRVGAYVRSEVEVARGAGVALPLAAVHHKGSNDSSVLVVSDGAVQMRQVQTGAENGTYVEITSGVAAGEQIVAKARSFLRSGDKVRAVLTSAEQPAQGANVAGPRAQSSIPDISSATGSN